MKRIRVSTVFVAMAALALAGTLTFSQLDGEAGRLTLGTPTAVFFFALFPVFATIGLVCSVILLFKDRSPMRWVEVGLSIAFLALLSRVH